jgi:hypothetical protein
MAPWGGERWLGYSRPLEINLIRIKKGVASVMRKMQIIGLSFATVFLLGGFAVSPAFASSKFLLNGEEVKSETMASQGSGEISLEDMKAPGPPDILCSKIEDYTGWWPFRRLVQWLMLNATPLLIDGTEGEPGVLCDSEDMKGVCSSVTVAVRGLPWKTEVVLSGSTYVELILSEAGKVPGYTVDCTTILGLIEDVCTGEMGMILTNVSGGVNAEFSENETINPPLNCSLGGEKSGLVLGSSLITSSSGTLTVSE